MIFAVEILSEGKVCHSLLVEVPHDLLRYLGRPKAASEVIPYYPFHPVSDQGKEWRCDIFPNSFTFFQEQLCDLRKMYHSSWWAFVRQEKMSSFFFHNVTTCLVVSRNIFTSGQQLALVVADSYRAAKKGAAAVQVKIAGANEGVAWRCIGDP